MTAPSILIPVNQFPYFSLNPLVLTCPKHILSKQSGYNLFLLLSLILLTPWNPCPPPTSFPGINRKRSCFFPNEWLIKPGLNKRPSLQKIENVSYLCWFSCLFLSCSCVSGLMVLVMSWHCRPPACLTWLMECPAAQKCKEEGGGRARLCFANDPERWCSLCRYQQQSHSWLFQTKWKGYNALCSSI